MASEYDDEAAAASDGENICFISIMYNMKMCCLCDPFFIQNVVFLFVWFSKCLYTLFVFCKDSLSTLDKYMDPGFQEKLDVR